MNKKIDFVIDKMMLELIDRYANANRINRSQAIREVLKHGIISMKLLEKIKRFADEQESWMMKAIKEGKNIGINIVTRTFERDEYKCRKCGSTTDIMEVELPLELAGRTFAGLECESKITLCKDCKKRLDVYIPRRYGLERFVEWYYEE